MNRGSLVKMVKEVLGQWEPCLEDGLKTMSAELADDPEDFLIEMARQAGRPPSEVLREFLAQGLPWEDPCFYELFTVLAWRFLTDRPVPATEEAVKEFILGTLTGRRPAPTFRGRQKDFYGNIPRDVLYGRLIFELVKNYNCLEYRNEADDPDPEVYALDVLAAATGLSYDRLKTIWRKSLSRRDLIEDKPCKPLLLPPPPRSA